MKIHWVSQVDKIIMAFYSDDLTICNLVILYKLLGGWCKEGKRVGVKHGPHHLK